MAAPGQRANTFYHLRLNHFYFSWTRRGPESVGLGLISHDTQIINIISITICECVSYLAAQTCLLKSDPAGLQSEFHLLNVPYISSLLPRSTWRWCGTTKRAVSARRTSSGIRTRPCSTWRELHCAESWRPSWPWDSAYCSCLITSCQTWSWR